MSEIELLCELPASLSVLVGCTTAQEHAVVAAVYSVSSSDDKNIDKAVVQRAQDLEERLPTGLFVVGIAAQTKHECERLATRLRADGGIEVSVVHALDDGSWRLNGKPAATTTPTESTGAWRVVFAVPLDVCLRVPLREYRPGAAHTPVHRALDDVADAVRPRLDALMKSKTAAWMLRDTHSDKAWLSSIESDSSTPVGEAQGPLLLQWFSTVSTAGDDEEVEGKEEQEGVCDVHVFASAVVFAHKTLPIARVAELAVADAMRSVGDAFNAAHFEHAEDETLGSARGFDGTHRRWTLLLPRRVVAFHSGLGAPVVEYCGTADEGDEPRSRLVCAFGDPVSSPVMLDREATAACLTEFFASPPPAEEAEARSGGGWCVLQ